MKPRLFLIFNHTITRLQREEAFASLRVEEIIDLPDEFKVVWNQIPADVAGINGHLSPLKAWLSGTAKSGDYVLIQGDFGACYLMVQFAFALDLVPVYSTTAREVVEEHETDGSVRLMHRFRHQAFRRYGV